MTAPGSLAHVPRRGVAMAKELRRMGLDVVSSVPPQEDKVMSSDVKQVSEVMREVAGLGERARTIKAGMRADLDEAHEALDIADGVRQSLHSTVAELRGILGGQTNDPPPADTKVPGGGSGGSPARPAGGGSSGG